MNRDGTALVLSAPSGAGKSTLSHLLLGEFPNLGYSVSCTTREMRPGETDGIDYFFISRDKFKSMCDAGEFAEWAEVHGNFYGTPLKPVKDRIRSGRDILFDIDVQGASQLKKSLPCAVFAFIVPPSMAELERRLRGRGCDDEDSIIRRMTNARKEIGEAAWYDAIILNDDLNCAYAALRSVYIYSTLAPAVNTTILNALMTTGGIK